MPYRFGRQLSVIPPSLNALKLPPNPFNMLATMAVLNPTKDGYDENYSPRSPEPSEPSTISTPPMNISTTEGLETPHTTTDDKAFCFDVEPRRSHFLPSSPSPPPPHRNLKRKMSLSMSFPKRRGVSQHLCEPCGQLLPKINDIPGSSSTN